LIIGARNAVTTSQTREVLFYEKFAYLQDVHEKQTF